MLHEILKNYLDLIESALSIVDDGYIEVWQEEILNPERGNIRIRVRFSNGFLLEINEAVLVNEEVLKHLNYRYHFQDDKDKLIFRYDNTTHFPDLPHFPDHKHEPECVKGTVKPSLLQLVHEVNRICG